MSILPLDTRILSFWSLEEKMNREGKGRWYLEKELFFCWGKIKRRCKRKIIFGEGKYIFSEENKTGKEKWRTNLETKNMFFVGEKVKSRGKGGKCLEKINIWIVEAKKNGEGNVRNYLEKQIFGQWRRRWMEKEKEVNIRQKDKFLRTNEGSL